MSREIFSKQCARRAARTDSCADAAQRPRRISLAHISAISRRAAGRGGGREADFVSKRNGR